MYLKAAYVLFQTARTRERERERGDPFFIRACTRARAAPVIFPDCITARRGKKMYAQIYFDGRALPLCAACFACLPASRVVCLPACLPALPACHGGYEFSCSTVVHVYSHRRPPVFSSTLLQLQWCSLRDAGPHRARSSDMEQRSDRRSSTRTSAFSISRAGRATRKTHPFAWSSQ